MPKNGKFASFSGCSKPTFRTLTKKTRPWDIKIIKDFVLFGFCPSRS